MSTGEVKKRFDAHKSMSSIADGLRKPERPTVASLKKSVSVALAEEKSAANDDTNKAKGKGKFSSLAAKLETDSATKAKDNRDSDNRSKSSKSSKGSKYSKSCSNLKAKLDKDNVKKEKEKDTDNCSKSSSKSKTRPYSKCQTTPVSTVPRRKKQLSRSKSSDGLEFPKRHRPKNNDYDNSEGKKPGLIRSKSSTGSKREKSTQEERSTARSLTNKVVSSITTKPKILVAPDSPLRTIMNSNENADKGDHRKPSALKTEKTMDEMIHLAWIKPIQEKEKEKEKSSASNKKGEKSSSKKSQDNKREKSSSKKKTSGLDQKLGKNKSKKNGNNEDEDVSVASSVIKPKTTKISASEWDKITKVPNRKMSWFGFFNADPKDDSSCEGSGLDQSFSSIGDDDDDNDNGLDGSLNVLDLIQDMQDHKDADENNESPSSSSDESSDESSSSIESSDESSSDESSTDISSSDSTNKNDKAKKKVDRDARAARKRASQLRKLQKKKKHEQKKKKKMRNGARGEPNPARRGGGRDRDAARHGAGPGGRSLRDEQFDGSRHNRRRQDGRGRDAMHQSVGPGIHNNARSGQDPFGFGDIQGPSNHVIEDFNSSQHGLGTSRHNRPLRSRSQDDSTARYDGRGEGKVARRGVQRTRSTDGGGFSNSRSNWDGGSRRGGRNVGAARFEDGGSRRGRRTTGEDFHQNDMNGSRRGPNKARGDPFDGPLNGSRHGRTAGGDPFNDFNSSQSGNFQVFPAVGATGGDPFDDFNNSFASLSGPSADPFGSAVPFVDFNNSQSSFHGNSSSRGSRSGGRARGKNLQSDALMASLHESQDQLAFVHAGKWMTEKEQEANGPPKIQPWEKRKKEKALF